MRVCEHCGACSDDEFDVCAVDGGALEPSLAGSRVLAGRYRLERQLAEGAMGQVFEAVHLAVGSRVAVKVMQPQQKDIRVAAQRFHKEARILGAVKHPHAVLITDFDVDTRASGPVAFLVTELLRGRSLAALLDEKRTLSLDEVERIVIPLAEAVEEAHAQGIIHRDIKPSNIFLERLRDGSDVVKVLDFGIAKLLARVGDDVPAPIRFGGFDSGVDATLRDEILAALDDDGADATVHERRSATAPTTKPSSASDRPGSTWAGLMVGTVPYMAPEQMTGERTTRRADVHALAVLVFEMLSGQLPFDGDDDEIIRLKLADERPSLAEHGVDVGSELDAILMQAFAVDPEERPDRVMAIADAVARAAAWRRGAMSDPVGALALRLSTTARVLSRLQDVAPDNLDVARDLLLSAGAALQRARAILPLAKAALSAPPQTVLVAAHLELDDVVANVRAPLVKVAEAHAEHGAQLMLLWRHIDVVVAAVAVVIEGEGDHDDVADDPLAGVLDNVDADSKVLPWGVLLERLSGRDPLDAESALDALVNDRVDETVRVLHDGGVVAERLLAVLWRHADALLLRDLGADRGALRFVPFLAGLAVDQGRFARVIEVLRDRRGVGVVDTIGDSEADEPVLRCLLLHPISEVRSRAASRVALSSLWTAIAHPRTPLAVIAVLFQQMKKRGHPDHLKVFFFCVRDGIAGASSSELREAVQLVRSFFEVPAFHEDLLFEPLLELERALRERAGAAGLLDDSYAHAVAVFVDEGVSDEVPLEHLRDVPLPLQRKLAREGRFLTTFVCHANERIAKECVPHLLRKDDVTRYLRLVTIHRVVLVELAKRRRFFKKDAPKLALLANPKTPAGIARGYVGLVGDEQLRVLANNRHINQDVRRLIVQRLERTID